MILSKICQRVRRGSFERMRGRKPKPVAMKLLGMTSSRAKKFRSANPTSVAPLVALADPPDWLTDAQKAEFLYVCENAPPGVLMRIDRALVAAYCVALDLHRQASIMLNKSTLLVRGRRDGEVISNPLLRIQRGQALVMFKAAEQLGFSPVARARLRGEIVAPVVADGWDEVS
jgi:P27 family predicted phage terminase small subunit